MKIYTKTGDKAKTSLYGGERVLKNHPRIEACGEIDELNSYIGFIISELGEENLIQELKEIQWWLFAIGAEVATPSNKKDLANGKKRLPVTLSQKEIEKIEGRIDFYQEKLPIQEFFILPGGGRISSLFHILRSVCRRAERRLIFLFENQEITPEIMAYFNRLSDYFFTLSRYVVWLSNGVEEYWKPREMK